MRRVVELDLLMIRFPARLLKIQPLRFVANFELHEDIFGWQFLPSHETDSCCLVHPYIPLVRQTMHSVACH